MDPAQKTESVIVLVSGGIESSVLLFDCLTRYDSVIPMYIQNHLRWEEVELFWLKKFLRNIKSSKLESLKTLDLTMRDLYEGHWSITGIRTPDSKSKDEAVYLPGRNIVFFCKAAIYAALHGISSIEIGILKGNPFSDSSKSFFTKMADVLSLGLSFGLTIKAPFSKMKKEEVIEIGKKLPLEYTFSCVNPKGYEHCGDCNKCTERKKAFFAAGLPDRTKYKKSGI